MSIESQEGGPKGSVVHTNGVPKAGSAFDGGHGDVRLVPDMEAFRMRLTRYGAEIGLTEEDYLPNATMSGIGDLAAKIASSPIWIAQD